MPLTTIPESLKTKLLLYLSALLSLATFTPVQAQTLNLPPRATNALAGSEFINVILTISQTARENWILDQVSRGNIPSWQRALVPITINQTISGVPHSLTYYVSPDYLAIGSDSDYFLEPMTPILAQRIANLLNCTLPTRLMVNQIWTNSSVKMTADTFSPSIYNIDSVPVFVLENTAVMSQRDTFSPALGALVSGDKKDIVISTLIYNDLTAGVPNPVVIYGWIQPDGDYIQEEYNGHSESYMDYSHGVRLVQMAVILDGATNTVTNILSDPVLWQLLGDEGQLTKPYYTIDNTIAPFITIQPYSQTINLGATANFSVAAVADPTLTYAWKFNGSPIPGATNSTLSVTNAQPANAGTYTVVLTNPYGTATNLPAVLKVNTNAFPLLFSDSLSADTSTNWNFIFSSAGGGPDYTTNWAFNFGNVAYTYNGNSYLIPPAPNTTDGSTRAVKFTVNDSNGINAAINIYPKNKSFSNNYALKFDMWINYPGGPNGISATGTTEYAISGINHLGTEANWDATNAASTDGMWFAVDGEGGAVLDYHAFLGNRNGIQTDLMGAAGGLLASNHTAAVFQTLFPPNQFETAGAPGKCWVSCEVSQTNNLLTWKMDGTIIAQRVNTSTFTNGDVMIGYMDIFPSIANPLAPAFVLFDNVRVEDWTSPPLLPPSVTTPPSSQTVFTGTNVTFTVADTGAAPIAYQWTFNGTNIPGATTNSYTLTAVQTTNAGVYSVILSNIVGSVISPTVQLTVNVLPIKLNPVSLLPNGNVQLSFTGALSSQYSIQISSNLLTWLPLATFIDASNPVNFLDTNAPANSPRFYRIVTP